MSPSSVALLLLAVCESAAAQASATRLKEPLGEEIMPAQVAVMQLRDYVLRRIAPPPKPQTAGSWSAETAKLRARMLETAFRGWPKEWIEASPKFEEVGVLPGDGYRIRKLRYEILPGFYSAALLYEPEHLSGKAPAILNVNGHVGPEGKAVEYKQKRCITFARNGALALSLEWFACGELHRKENNHFYGPHLEFAGAHELGLFYLAMRRGLDFLYNHPNTDRNRLGMTGLSGGGWQTIFLSALDERVRAAVPVAGFSSIASRIEVHRYGDVGDPEQSPTDIFTDADYTHLAAMMAPRPMLLAYNAEDDCCFRAPVVKPLIFDGIRPIYALFDRQNAIEWHENADPGTHNYQLDNRLAAYRFFSRVFNLPAVETEGATSSEVRTYEDLAVGLPDNNLTILDLARKLTAKVDRAPAEPAPAARARLRKIVRYRSASINRAWTVGISKHEGVETKAHLFQMAGGLDATGVWAKAIETPSGATLSIVLDDDGRAATGEAVSERVNRGEQVLALDLPFFGPAWAPEKGAWEYEQMLYAIGDRPLGIEAAQLVAITHWMAKSAGVAQARIQVSGIRGQTVALVAAALEPGLFAEITVQRGMRSLEYVVRKPIEFASAPDLFCLDLYKETDIDRLAALAAPTTVRTASFIE